MRIVFYAHGGSDNHGCEAIVRSSASLIPHEIVLYSSNKAADVKYGIDKIPNIKEIYQNRTFDRKLLLKALFKVSRKIFDSRHLECSYVYHKLLSTKGSVVLHIGGDNYCYGFPSILIICNKRLSKYNKTVLWGCSITPELCKNTKIKQDLERYSLIIARESITYNSLRKNNINTKIVLYPDPAFGLPINETQLPEEFEDGNMIGINISPIVIKNGGKNNLVLTNYFRLIDYIINYTTWGIALIPHVLFKNNNDLEAIAMLHEKYKDNPRVIRINDCDCCELKYVISKCRMFIGARTHSTIAAYSTCVPTLVLGYSVKARGIATDLFGGYENYVLDSGNLDSDNSLLEAFQWLCINEDSIRLYLKSFIPSYIERLCNLSHELQQAIYAEQLY